MEQDPKNEWLYYDYGLIYTFLQSEFRLNKQSINDIVVMVVAEHYKIKVVTPLHGGFDAQVWWLNITTQEVRSLV
jgi:hypothetical protein